MLEQSAVVVVVLVVPSCSGARRRVGLKLRSSSLVLPAPGAIYLNVGGAAGLPEEGAGQATARQVRQQHRLLAVQTKAMDGWWCCVSS